MCILGLIFAGTSTSHRSEMINFLTDTLSLPLVQVDGLEADLFGLPDGSTFAVASPGGMGDTTRSVGFLVDDLEAAAAGLREAGVEVGPIAENKRGDTCTFVLRTASFTSWWNAKSILLDPGKLAGVRPSSQPLTACPTSLILL